MQQLTGLDALFLGDDSATTSGVIVGMLVLDREGDPEAGSAARMRARILDRLPRIPPLRWQLVNVPLGLDYPYWAEVATVDVDAHLHTVTLPAPGGSEQLAAEVARLSALPMAMNRPMWDYHVIDGLEDGRIAHVFRVHHVLVDGGSVPAVMELLSDDPPEVDGETVPPRLPEPIGGRVEMLARGVVGTALRPARFAWLELGTVKWLGSRLPRDGVFVLPAWAARLTPGELGAPLRAVLNRKPVRHPLLGRDRVDSLMPTIRKPRTPFNGRLSRRRTYAYTSLPLVDLKRVAKSFGVSLNDVALTVSAGALRRYLADHGGIPERPLVVCIPISVRHGQEKHRWTNHVSMFWAPLPTHLADPVERLHAASEAAHAGRRTFEALPVHLLRTASTFVPPAVFTRPAAAMSAAPDWVPVSGWNVVVSNLRGPKGWIRLAGARTVSYHPVPFLTPGMGLSIALQSCVDRFEFGLLGCPDLTPDLWPLTEHLAEALDELLRAADGRVLPVEASRSAEPSVEAQNVPARVTPIRSRGDRETNAAPSSSGH